MGILDVGIENLPNTYVNKIVVTPTQVKVTCLLKDDREIPTWRGREELKTLKVKGLLLHDFNGDLDAYNRIYLSFLSGQNSLYNYRQQSINLFETNYICQTAQATTFTPIETQLSQNSEDRFYFKTLVFDVPDARAIQNFSFFCACYLDDFGFENEMFNKYYGPVSGEIIKENGFINQVSGYFYNPETDEEYGGPVHEHEGVYMEGSKHSEEPHATLRYVVEPNNKIFVEY